MWYWVWNLIQVRVTDCLSVSQKQLAWTSTRSLYDYVYCRWHCIWINLIGDLVVCKTKQQPILLLHCSHGMLVTWLHAWHLGWATANQQVEVVCLISSAHLHLKLADQLFKQPDKGYFEVLNNKDQHNNWFNLMPTGKLLQLWKLKLGVPNCTHCTLPDAHVQHHLPTSIKVTDAWSPCNQIDQEKWSKFVCTGQFFSWWLQSLWTLVCCGPTNKMIKDLLKLKDRHQMPRALASFWQGIVTDS